MAEWVTMFNKLTSYETDESDAHCDHSEVIDDSDHTICIDCGTILGRTLVTPQFVANNSLRRKQIQCTIYNDIPVEFDPAVKNMATNIYNAVTHQKIFRCVLRKSILAACIYRASIILNAPLSVCFHTFNLSSTDANKGIIFVANNVPRGEYSIPFMSDDIDIMMLCESHDVDLKTVSKLYNLIKTDCEDIIASSQRVALIHSCTWTVMKVCGKHRDPSISDFVEKIGARMKTKRTISVVTIEKKHQLIMRYLLSRVMKKVISRCTPLITTEKVLRSTTPRIPVTFYTDTTTLVADDGFVYPLEDVDDVMDWNVIFQMTFSERVVFPISINKKLVVSFSGPLKSVGTDFIHEELNNYIKS